MTRRPSPVPPPEAELIKRAQKRSGLTVDQAAKQAGISRSRWNQITAGYQSVSGTPMKLRAPEDTLARMALVVGVLPDQLREAGRADGADALEELARNAPPAARSVASPTLDAITSLMASLSPEEQDEVMRRLGRKAAQPNGDTPERTDFRHVG